MTPNKAMKRTFLIVLFCSRKRTTDGGRPLIAVSGGIDFTRNMNEKTLSCCFFKHCSERELRS